jgi:hypothetical protein
MERRKFVVTAMSLSSLAALQACMGGGGMPGGLMSGGGGGGASWTDVAKSAKAAATKMANGALGATEALGSLGKAIGFKQNSALVAGTIQKAKDGDINALSDVTKASAAYNEDLLKALEDKKSYTADEKKAVGKAIGEYAVAVVNFVLGMNDVMTAVNQAQNAGQPNISDLEAIKIAKDLPALGKVISANGMSYVTSVKQYIKLAKMNDIALPKEAEESANKATASADFS